MIKTVNLKLLILATGLALNSSVYAQSNVSVLDFTCSKLDEQGVLWFGTKGEGLWRVQGNNIEPFTAVGQEARADYYAMTLDPQGHLWLTTQSGLIEYDYQQWKDLPMLKAGTATINNVASVDERNRIVRSLSVNHLDHVLMGSEDPTTGQQILMRHNGHTYVDLIKPFKAPTVFEDMDALIWMAGGAYKMEGGKLVLKVSMPQGVIIAALQDSRGDVWLAIDKGGIYRYDGESFRFYGDDHGFSNLRINCLHEDVKGKIWMGTESMSEDRYQGLSYFEAGLFHHLQDSPSCPVKSVNTIASDKKGNVWFAGNDGALFRYAGHKFHLVETTGLLEKR